MPRRRDNLPLLLGSMVSLLLHVAVLLPALWMVLRSPAQHMSINEALGPEHMHDTMQPPPEEEDVLLGIDAPTPSTLTWIGYEEYEQHLAQLSQVDQAAFRMEPAGTPTLDPKPPVPIVTPITPVEPEATSASGEMDEPVEEPAEDSSRPEVEEGEPVEAPPALPTLTPAPAGAEPVGLGMSPESADGQEPDQSPDQQVPTAPQIEALLQAVLRIPPQGVAESDRQTEADTDPAKADQTKPQPVQQPQQPVPTPSAPTDPRPADVSNRESDATSIEDVPLKDIKPGKPVAAHGISIATKRPKFTLLQRVTAAPVNPVVEIRFGADGKPTHVQMLQSSGSPSLNSTIEANIYSWQAYGRAFEERIEREGEVVIRMRIVVNPRARNVSPQ